MRIIILQSIFKLFLTCGMIPKRDQFLWHELVNGPDNSTVYRRRHVFIIGLG